MSSPLRIAASRASGAKSRGPVTEAGKHNSSLNAIRHGLLSGTLVGEGESAQRFGELLDRMIEQFQPQTDSEMNLVESMAVGRWRQLRIWGLDTQNLSEQIRDQTGDTAAKSPGVRAALAFRGLADNSRSLDLFNRYEVRFERQFLRSLRELRMEISNRPELPESKAS